MNFEKPKPPQAVMILAAVAVFMLYCLIVFIGEALLFAVYQFLRDRGWSFWEATMIVTSMFAIIAIPTIGRRVLK
jgi:hypothetical protein